MSTATPSIPALATEAKERYIRSGGQGPVWAFPKGDLIKLYDLSDLRAVYRIVDGKLRRVV